MEKQETKLLHVELTEKIIGLYYDVYNEIGHGFLESVYSNAMYQKVRVHPRESALKGSSEACE